MSDDTSKRRLGRGLSALFGDEEKDYADLDKIRATKSVPLEFVEPGRHQPRQRFDAAEMAALVASVREKGVLQPILVRRHPDAANKYEIVAGERRWRASQQAQLYEIPVIIREISDSDALEISLIENLQREALAPLEEAGAYRRLMAEYNHSQSDMAKAVGKSRSHVANTLRLLELPDKVKQMLTIGEFTAGHARAMLTAEDPVAVAKAVVAKGLNVRQTESLCQRSKPRPVARAKPLADAAPEKDADTLALERNLSNLLGLRVAIQFHGSGGSITIHYKTLEQLDDVLHRLNQAPARVDTGDGGAARDVGADFGTEGDGSQAGAWHGDGAMGADIATALGDRDDPMEMPGSPSPPSPPGPSSAGRDDGGAMGQELAMATGDRSDAAGDPSGAGGVGDPAADEQTAAGDASNAAPTDGDKSPALATGRPTGAPVADGSAVGGEGTERQQASDTVTADDSSADADESPVKS
ncbi:MAG: ParB/RepB/Spo0J family partition protein [Alphaproteobacteria bacterium]